jgi:hypothetical protein
MVFLISSKSHMPKLARYAYVAAPPGDGIDTHRFCEALYLRTVPVTLNSNWARWFIEQGIPMLIVDDFEELNQITEEELTRRYFIEEENFYLPILSMPY